MADLRIVDAPEIPTENITGEEKLPTGGSGNYSITLDSVADYTKTKKDLADNTAVDAKVNGVRQELNAHIEDSTNPHQVTKVQIGLGNVNNTADLDKPVSNSTQAAIISAVAPKADKTYVDSRLSNKADKTYVDNQDSVLQTQIDQKATSEYLDIALFEQTQTVNTALSNLSTTANKFYPTLAEANADIANIAVNQPVNIGEVSNGGLWYKATAGATSLTKSAYDPLTQGMKYSSALFGNENSDLSKKFDSIIRDFLKSSAPITGNYSESTSRPQANQNSANTLYVLPTPFQNGAKIGQIALHSLTGSGTITLKTFTLLNGIFTVSRTLKAFDIYKVGVNLYNFSEEPMVLNNGEYVGFQTTGSAKGVVTVSNAQETESIKYYANADYIGNTVPITSQGKTAVLNIALYAETFNNALNEKMIGLDRGINTLSKYIYTDTYGTVLEPELKSKQSVLAHLIVNKLGPVDIKLFKIYAQQVGRIKVGVYSRSGDIFTRLSAQNFNLGVGLNTFTLDIELGSNEYIGVQVLDVGVVAFSDASEGANTTFVSTSTAETFTPTLNSANAFQFQFIGKSKESESKKWLGKTYTSFGDSITWYNGRNFATTHIESGQLVKGYQSYIVDSLGCTLDNKGESGWDMTQIFASRINTYDFTNCYLTTITSGANDCRKGVPVGTLQPFGSAFNTSTYAGALQASIEKVIASNPDTKIVLITPIRGWYSEFNTSNVPNTDPSVVGVLNRQYPEIMKEIAKLYGIPVVDFYDELGWNDLNKSHFLGDNPAVFTAYLLHPTNKGFQRMGEILLSKLKNL